MYKVKPYTRPNGRQPAREYLKDLPSDRRAPMQVRVQKLREEGLVLLDSEMMRRINGYQHVFYELRTHKDRIAVYHDTTRNVFVLIYGFKKQKNIAIQELTKAHGLVKEYIASQTGG